MFTHFTSTASKQPRCFTTESQLARYRYMEAQTRDAITGIGLVAFGAIAVIALCIGVCALADAVSRVVA